MNFKQQMAARRPARSPNPVSFTSSIELVANAWRITIRRGTFVAYADFPLSMGDVANDRYLALHTNTDVEDLLREFGSTKDYHQWQRLT
jgi:hypothetical protein